MLSRLASFTGKCPAFKIFEEDERAFKPNLIAQPDASQQSVADATNNMLKAITASLLMEQVLAPNFKFKTKLPNDESKHISGEF